MSVCEHEFIYIYLMSMHRLHDRLLICVHTCKNACTYVHVACIVGVSFDRRDGLTRTLREIIQYPYLLRGMALMRSFEGLAGGLSSCLQGLRFQPERKSFSSVEKQKAEPPKSRKCSVQSHTNFL